MWACVCPCNQVLWVLCVLPAAVELPASYMLCKLAQICLCATGAMVSGQWSLAKAHCLALPLS